MPSFIDMDPTDPEIPIKKDLQEASIQGWKWAKITEI